ncbi:MULTISPECIES: cache domain-containing protein, partial [unclassified Campylobacter]
MGRFSHLKISTKISLSVVLIVIVVISILSYFILSQVTKTVIKQNEVLMRENVLAYTNFIEGNLQEMLALINAEANHLNASMNSLSFDELYTSLESHLDSSDFLDYAYVYLKDSKNISSDADSAYFTKDRELILALFDEDPKKKGYVKRVDANDYLLNSPVIKNVFNTKQAVVGEPNKIKIENYDFFGLNIAYPLFDKNHQVIGVVGIVFDLKAWSDLMADTTKNLYPRDVRTILSSTGNIIAHKNDNYLGKAYDGVNNTTQSSSIITDIKQGKAKKDALFIKNFRTIAYPNDDSFAIIAPIKISNLDIWYLFSTSVQSEIVSSLTHLQNIIIIVVIISLIIIVCLVYFLTNKIVGSRLPILVKSLSDFFRFLNHEKINLSMIKIRAQDELGAIGTM